MVGWHHQLNEYEFEQAPGVGDRQGSLAFCNPWGCKELDMTSNLTEPNPFWKPSLFFFSPIGDYLIVLCVLSLVF